MVAQVRHPGGAAHAVLSEALPKLIGDIRFDMSMRWNETGIAFSRPIRWLLALHGKYLIQLEYAGVKSNRSTRLMRFDNPDILTINAPADYWKALDDSKIMLDPARRKTAIQAELARLAKEVGGEVVDDPALLDEVVNLVEQPTALRGSFDSSFLELPRAVLVSVMKKHQRYFPIEDKGKLLPFFIAVRNGGEEHLETVTRGNEQVIRARFADAAYFIERDAALTLEEFLPRLATMTFEKSLGSMLDKVGRVEALVESVATRLALGTEERTTARRAANLCKADLATQMVVEMTSLQGEVGRIYALKAGESEPVAQAIFEHYLPRYAGDQVPQSRPGLTVGLADRLDTLIGLFAAGRKPSGARDPFALRRTAIGLVQVLVEHQQRFDLRQALMDAAALQPLKEADEQVDACLEFIATREQALLLEKFPHDAVEAVLAEQSHDPAGAAAAVAQLGIWRQRQDWPALLQAYARCVRITRDLSEHYQADPSMFSEPAEIALHQAVLALEVGDAGSIDTFLQKIEQLLPAITKFFEDVLVMADKDQVRHTRLGLLQQIAQLAQGVADFSLLEGF